MNLLFILSGLLLLGGAAGLATRAIALPRWRAQARLQVIASYGSIEGHDVAFDEDRGPRGIHGVATMIGEFAAGRARVDLEEIRKLLVAAGRYRARPETFLGYRIIATVLLGAVALTLEFGSPLDFLKASVLPSAGWVLPSFLLKRLGTARRQAIDDALPDLVDLLVVTVEAGLSFSGSLQAATQRIGGPLGDELRLAMQEQRMGLPITQALNNMLSRTDSSSMRSFVQSVTQAEKLGVSIGGVLRGIAVEMRKRRRSRAEERANKAPIKMLFPLVFLIFPSLFVVILGPGAMTLIEALRDTV